MEQKRKITLGISVGDPNGIGIELVLKAFEDKRIFDFFTPVVYAQGKTLNDQRKQLGLRTSFSIAKNPGRFSNNQLNVVELGLHDFKTSFGQPNKESGMYALKSLTKATQALKKGEIDVLVTAPIDKHNIQSESFSFPGHTDYLANELGGDSLMLMVAETLRVGLLTDHIPVKDIAATITGELIEKKVKLMEESLKLDFGIPKPKIAVLGINPHTGDKGVIGQEDDAVLRPKLKELNENGKLVYGPYAADSFFGAQQHLQFDGILASYHDQGLTPFKTLAFGKGVNFTAGLNKVRTSPDHGTAFEIAGKSVAEVGSFEEALFLARDVFFERSETQAIQEEKKGEISV